MMAIHCIQHTLPTYNPPCRGKQLALSVPLSSEKGRDLYLTIIVKFSKHKYLKKTKPFLFCTCPASSYLISASPSQQLRYRRTQAVPLRKAFIAQAIKELLLNFELGLKKLRDEFY